MSYLFNEAATGAYTPSSVSITGGTIDGTTIGGATPAAATFSVLTTKAVVNTVTLVTSGASYTLSSSDGIVIVNKSSGSATAIALPSSPATGRTVTIKDGKGDAATNNITITPAAGTIDGASNLLLNVAYASAVLIYSGSAWNIV